jgi:hypothetical protein
MKIVFIDDDDEFFDFWRKKLSYHNLFFQNDLILFLKNNSLNIFDIIISDYYFYKYNLYDILEKNNPEKTLRIISSYLT